MPHPRYASLVTGELHKPHLRGTSYASFITMGTEVSITKNVQITNLSPGIYTVIISDAGGKTISYTFELKYE